MKVEYKKLKEYEDKHGIIYYIIIGIIIGTASVLPAFSGGGMAVAFNIYDKLIFTINECLRLLKYIILPSDDFINKYIKKEKNIRYNLFQRIKIVIVSGLKNYGNFVISIFIGILLSIVLLAKFLNYALDIKPLLTTAIFLGLLIGTVPKMFYEAKSSKDLNIKENNKRKNKIINISIFSLILIVVSFITIKGGSIVNNGNANNNESINGFFDLIITGGLIALFSIIPGVSWALILMLIGNYKGFLEIINKGEMLKLGIIFVGIIVTAIPLVKLMEKLLKKYKQKTFYGILGFVIASIIKITVDTLILSKVKLKYALLLIIVIAISAVISYYLINLIQKNETKDKKI